MDEPAYAVTFRCMACGWTYVCGDHSDADLKVLIGHATAVCFKAPIRVDVEEIHASS